MKGAQQVTFFVWSFKPIFLLMNLIAGLKLQPSINSFIINFAICSWGFLLIFFNILVNGFQAAYNWYYFTDNFLNSLRDSIFQYEDVSEQSRLLMIEHVDYFYRYLFLVLGVHLIFSVHCDMTGKWKKLWCTLQKIQLEMELTQEFYTKCRQMCFFGLGLFGLVFLYIHIGVLMTFCLIYCHFFISCQHLFILIMS